MNLNLPNLAIGGAGASLVAITPGQGSEIVIAVVTTVMQLIHLFKSKKRKKDETQKP